MQNTPINPNLTPLYTALGIAAYNGCINAQDLLNDRVSYNLWPLDSQNNRGLPQSIPGT